MENFSDWQPSIMHEEKKEVSLGKYIFYKLYFWFTLVLLSILFILAWYYLNKYSDSIRELLNGVKIILSAYKDNAPQINQRILEFFQEMR